MTTATKVWPTGGWVRNRAAAERAESVRGYLSNRAPEALFRVTHSVMASDERHAMTAALQVCAQALGYDITLVDWMQFASASNLWQAVDEWPEIFAPPLRAATAQDVARAIGQKIGPVLLGLDWLDGMNRADASGVVSWTGEKQGQHVVALVGVVPGRGVRIVNCWGSSYGQSGRAWLPLADLKRAMDADAEAAVLRLK